MPSKKPNQWSTQGKNEWKELNDLAGDYEIPSG